MSQLSRCLSHCHRLSTFNNILISCVTLSHRPSNFKSLTLDQWRTVVKKVYNCLNKVLAQHTDCNLQMMYFLTNVLADFQQLGEKNVNIGESKTSKLLAHVRCQIRSWRENVNAVSWGKDIKDMCVLVIFFSCIFSRALHFRMKSRIKRRLTISTKDAFLMR